MKVTILEISYRNIRNFKNIKINLKKNDIDNYKMSLIMMPNGTGKTTTLELLRLLLNQKATGLKSEEILSFKPEGKNIDTGRFAIRIKVGERVYSLQMDFDYFNHTVKYNTTSVQSTKGGKRKGWAIEELKEDFTEEFVNRFVFDGELANSMLELDQSEAENAIKYLYGIDKINIINTIVDELLEERINSAERQSKASTDRGLKRIQNEYEKYTTKKQELSNQRSDLKSKLRRYNKQYSEYDKKYNELLEGQDELHNKKSELEKKRNIVKLNKEENIKELVIQMKKPENLSICLKENLDILHSNLKVLKLPKNISKQFFCDLAEADKCICGRCIAETERQYILSEANQYLGEESIGFLNAMKESISNVVVSSDISGIIENIMESSNQIISVQNQIDKVTKQIEKKGGNELKKIKEKMETLKVNITAIQSKLDMLESRDSDDSSLNPANNIFLCEQKIRESKAKFGDASGVKSYIDSCEILKDMISSIEDKTLNKLKNRIIVDTNNRIASVIDRDNIEIDKIEGGISIKGKSGVSVGQALSVVYCFLGTMFEKSIKKLPFIIDSPCNSLDLEVRANIAQIIPEMFNQVIIFIISSEKAAFIENLAVEKEDLQFLTVYKEKKDSEEVKLEYGYEFFDRFQEEEE